MPLKQAFETCFVIFLLNVAALFGLKSILDFTLMKANLANLNWIDFFSITFPFVIGIKLSLYVVIYQKRFIAVELNWNFSFRRPLSGSVGASSFVENSIPMTTTLVNRMNRRSPTSPYVNRSCVIEHQRRSDPETIQKRKVSCLVIILKKSWLEFKDLLWLLSHFTGPSFSLDNLPTFMKLKLTLFETNQSTLVKNSV